MRHTPTRPGPQAISGVETPACQPCMNRSFKRGQFWHLTCAVEYGLVKLLVMHLAMLLKELLSDHFPQDHAGNQ